MVGLTCAGFIFQFYSSLEPKMTFRCASDRVLCELPSDEYLSLEKKPLAAAATKAFFDHQLTNPKQWRRHGMNDSKRARPFLRREKRHGHYFSIFPIIENKAMQLLFGAFGSNCGRTVTGSFGNLESTMGTFPICGLIRFHPAFQGIY